jgi:anthranilate phosphoribosyltransferase
VLGVAREDLLMSMAGALARRKTLRRAFVIHGKDAEGKGLDEASIEGPTLVVAVLEGQVAQPQILVPRELGLVPPPRHALRVADRAEALTVARGIFGGAAHADFRPAVADAVALQAALGLLLHRNVGLERLGESLKETRARIDRGFSLPFSLPSEAHP